MGQSELLDLGGGDGPPERVPWGVPEAAGLMFLFLGLQAFLASVVGPAEGELAAHLWIGAVSHGGLLALALGMVYVLSARAEGEVPSVPGALGLRLPRGRFGGATARVLLLGIVAYLAGAHALHGAVEFFGGDWDAVPEQPLSRMIGQAEGTGVVVLAFTLAVVLAPLAEEVLFRSVLYLPLRSRLGPVPGALIVGAVFALVHTYLPGLLHLFLLSVVFTALFESTGSLWLPVVAHALYNGLKMLQLRLA